LLFGGAQPRPLRFGDNRESYAIRFCLRQFTACFRHGAERFRKLYERPVEAVEGSRRLGLHQDEQYGDADGTSLFRWQAAHG
jgi:hypothetical protein